MANVEEARELALGTVARVTRMLERVRAVEASLTDKVRSGSKHPDLPGAVSEAHAIVRDAEDLLGRLATLAEKCAQKSGRGQPN